MWEKTHTKSAHLHKYTCVHKYLGMFLEGDAYMVTVVAIERA